MKTRLGLIFLGVMALAGSLKADDSSTRVIHRSDTNGAGDSAVLIQTTKNPRVLPDYEIVAGEEEISGDPTAGVNEARKSWKEACKEWKKELKENNKDSQILTSNCGTPKFVKDETSGAGAGIYTFVSQGKFRLRVRIRDKN